MTHSFDRYSAFDSLENLTHQVPSWNELNVEPSSCAQLQDPSHSSEALPIGCWVMTIHFTLATPYFSRAESHILNPNMPIVRDRLSGKPIVKGTTWKGNLRQAALAVPSDQDTVLRLFGHVPDDDNGTPPAQKGFLRFSDSQLCANNSGVKQTVMTPLSRKSGTPAHGPITGEIVPKGSTGEFTVRYVPISLADIDPVSDLKIVTKWIRHLFNQTGFSAYKKRGYGKADVTTIRVQFSDHYYKTGTPEAKDPRLSTLASLVNRQSIPTLDQSSFKELDAELNALEFKND